MPTALRPLAVAALLVAADAARADESGPPPPPTVLAAPIPTPRLRLQLGISGLVGYYHFHQAEQENEAALPGVALRVGVLLGERLGLVLETAGTAVVPSWRNLLLVEWRPLPEVSLGVGPAYDFVVELHASRSSIGCCFESDGQYHVAALALRIAIRQQGPTGAVVDLTALAGWGFDSRPLGPGRVVVAVTLGIGFDGVLTLGAR